MLRWLALLACMLLWPATSPAQRVFKEARGRGVSTASSRPGSIPPRRTPPGSARWRAQQVPGGQPAVPRGDPFVAGPRTYAPRLDPSDQFRADPETYAPRYDRRVRGRAPRLKGRLFFPDVGYAPLVFAPQDARVERWEAEPPAGPEGRDPFVAPPPADHSAATPPPPVVPAVPKTFYVIRGCYAGDRPPRQDALPVGCRVEDVTTIEPR